PGLSTDIAPISIMVVKLVIQELLKGTETTLRSLEDDLIAPWYMWLNRREPGTQYENLEPLEFNISGMNILRWYGIDVTRH
ncbi:MAG: ThiF family adenylyltransferase, partial [Anaerolineae bacterium]|nr:ThiF family adenylyltransferase [Anaerolineae bacterium]NIO00218.1 ThiF family adenylyltransferase [Anaerolineae bacterium]